MLAAVVQAQEYRQREFLHLVPNPVTGSRRRRALRQAVLLSERFWLWVEQSPLQSHWPLAAPTLSQAPSSFALSPLPHRSSAEFLQVARSTRWCVLQELRRQAVL